MKALWGTNLGFHFSKDNESLLEDFKTKMIQSAFSEAILAILGVRLREEKALRSLSEQLGGRKEFHGVEW